MRKIGMGAFAAAALLLSPDALAQTVTMKIGTATVNDAQHEWMRRYQARIEQKTAGRVKVELYTAGSLGSIPRQIEGTQLGTQEANVVPPAFLVGVDPRFQVLDAPGLFADGPQLMRVLNDPAFRPAFMSIGESKNLFGAAIIYTAPTEIVVRRPIRTLDEFKGVKVRVFGSPMQTLPMARIGATGAPMSLDETLPALQTGTIDGVFGSIAIFIPFKYWAVAKHMVHTNFSHVISMTIVHKPWLEKLPADLRKIVVDEAVAVEPEINQWSYDNYDRAMKLWVENGGERIKLPSADQAEMMKRLTPIGEEVVRDKPPVKEMFDLMVKTAQARR